MERRGNVLQPDFSSWRPAAVSIDGTSALRHKVDIPSAPRLSVVAESTTTLGKLPVTYADRNVSSLTERRLAQERPSEDAELEAWNAYFDTHWQEEGLSQDWYNLKSQMSSKRVGFIMDRQLSALDPLDRTSVLDTAIKTERDIAGFKLEFLSNHNVYPRMYYQNRQYLDRLEDPLYGESKVKKGAYADIVEIISDEERNGAVKNSMQRVKKFLLSAPEGAMTIMTSPLGETGFKTDDGLGIRYPDSYFFIGVKGKDGQVMNYTIKTNFTLKECRAVIGKIAGIKLHEGASLEEYVEAIATINPSQSKKVKSIFDVVNVLQDIHPDNAFVDNQNGKVTLWDDVRNDISDGEKLYDFDKRSTSIIGRLRKFMTKAVYRTKEEFRKGIASAILLLGDDFLQQDAEELLKVGIEMNPSEWITPNVIPLRSYGAVLEATASRRGCSGGGEATSVITVGGERSAIKGGENKCTDCGKDAKNNHYHCPDCNKEYSDETKVSSENRTKKCACGFEFGC